MRSNRRTGTRPELALRSELHRRGLRYRVDRPIPTGRGRVRPDVAFASAKVAVFVDGCFWHRCPIHGTQPRRNAAFWMAKLDRNEARDRANDRALREAGWTVVRVWEHEAVEIAAGRIQALVLRSTSRSATSKLDQRHTAPAGSSVP